MQFYEMQFRAVTFVLAEAIFRETRAEVAHNRVARHLRDHARRRDAEAVAIAVDDRRLRQRERENREAIDEDGLWYILGRSDDTIKVAGKRVGPAEIECPELQSVRSRFADRPASPPSAQSRRD